MPRSSISKQSHKTTSKFKRLNWFSRFSHQQKIVLALFVIGFGAIGTYFIFMSSAQVVRSPLIRGSMGELVIVKPARFYDSRVIDKKMIAAKKTLAVQITEKTVDQTTIPKGTKLVVATVTAVSPTENGYATVWDGSPNPRTWPLFYTKGKSTSNQLTIPLNDDGKLAIWGSAGNVHYVVDVVGYIAGERTNPAGLRFYSLNQARLYDTQTIAAKQPLAPKKMISVAVRGKGGVPESAKAALVNVTALSPDFSGFARFQTNGVGNPGGSHISFSRGQNTSSQMMVPIGDDGSVQLYNIKNSGSAHFTIDVVGYYAPRLRADRNSSVVNDSLESGRYIRAPRPDHAFNTQFTADKQPVGANKTLAVPLRGRAGIPEGASHVVVSIVVQSPTASGYARVGAAGAPVASGSPVYFSRMQDTSHRLIVPIGENESIQIWNSAGATHYLVDVEGYITNRLVDGKPVLLKNPGQHWSMMRPAANVWRFEARKGDFSDKFYDPKNGNRRTEFVAAAQDRSYGAGEEVWQSWSTILGDSPAFSDKQGIITQWHSLDWDTDASGNRIARRPVLGVLYGAGKIWFYACSDDVVRCPAASEYRTNPVKPIYTLDMPAKGEVINFLMRFKFGQTGSIELWVSKTEYKGSTDGKGKTTQIGHYKNSNIPIGYYKDTSYGKPRNLGYPHWGIYMTDAPAGPAIVYHANMEWGTDSLAKRIGNPLPVPRNIAWN